MPSICQVCGGVSGCKYKSGTRLSDCAIKARDAIADYIDTGWSPPTNGYSRSAIADGIKAITMEDPVAAGLRDNIADYIGSNWADVNYTKAQVFDGVSAMVVNFGPAYP